MEQDASHPVESEPTAAPPGGRGRRKALFVAATVVLTVVVLGVLCELIAWAVMVPCWPTYLLPQHYPHAHVRVTAGLVSAEWTANSQGFHDVEHPFDKPDGERRIVVIGDSFLDGPQQTPLPMRLRERLRRADPHQNVINLSRPGIDTNLYYVLARYALRTYHPDDLVVFVFEGNDFRAMEQFYPDQYRTPQGLVRRYPEASWLGTLLPRTSIMLCDLADGKFVTRFTDVRESHRWGKPWPKRDTRLVGLYLAPRMDREGKEIQAFLDTRLTAAEKAELENHPVRLDMLAYMTAVGMKARMTHLLRVKGERPEITDPAVAEKQVQSVRRFLGAIRDECAERDVRFRVVQIPTSLVDPDCLATYRRLGAAEDPLFARTRVPQARRLRTLLGEDGIEVIDLAPLLREHPGSYLRYDTHWSEAGVDVIAKYLARRLK